MNKSPIPADFTRRRWWPVAAAVLSVAWYAASAAGQDRLPPAPEQAAKAAGVSQGVTSIPTSDPDPPVQAVQQAGCSTCGGGSLGPPATLGSGGCGGPGCIPGRFNECCDCTNSTVVGRFFCELYHCICCPDRCYEPRWEALADSAFFVDAARPQTQLRLRWDTGFNLENPDRAEYVWAREAVNSTNPPDPHGRASFGKGPNFLAKSFDYEQLSLYTEAAAARASVSFEMPYRHLDPDAGLVAGPNPPIPESGFGDIIIGAKALIMDCELMQLSTLFKTYIPAGNFTQGLGTGHVSLEPSILASVRVSPTTYIQTQLSYWIPIAGDPVFQSDIFHCHFSLNHLLWQPFQGVKFIGTAELNEWSVLYGRYTVADFTNPDGTFATAPAAATMVSAGPGVRMFVCDKIDLGVGTAFALTGAHWEEELIRVEFRWRF